MSNQTKQHIQQALNQFAQGDLRGNSLRLLETLGYRSERQLDLDSSPSAFRETFDQDGRFRPAKALFDQWTAVHFLCQITDADIRQANQMILLDSAGKTIDNAIIESYLFLALGLRGDSYSRTQLAQITREVNKLFAMPVLIIFRHGDTLTLSIINRRLHKRERSQDVLEKVTLIKDVRLANPHRAHLEILFDLSLDELHRVHQFTNFVELHRAWQTTLDSSELNKKFFREIANWYFWAVNEVTFPPGAGAEETRNATSIIRLLTRLIFVWFLKEKGVIPDELFDRRALERLLTGKDPQDSAFYKAILQNLFFATLNQEMNTPQKPDNRKFRGAREGGQSQHYLIHNVYRYERYFSEPQAALALFADIPFLNGGLFECLDGKVDGKEVRVDGFSDRADNPLRVPDELFFGAERQIDLNETYGTSGKRYQVRGLIETLKRYKFTIAENTPIEEEIALDPELLGKVFENLLAAYNPETGTTARKQTGSFYTPREIVNYMVDESLLAYLETKLNAGSGGFSRPPAEAGTTNLEARLRHLFAYNEEPHQFSEAETAALIEAIDRVNILDPACGSGAFPMGILHKLVFILAKLDPNNAQWRAVQRRKALAETEETFKLGSKQEREERLLQINDIFERNSSDYGRKLYLIENCIYGVDIQPVAVQIAKLRFFISLVVDQRLDDAAPNRGILPLPNLETKFVAANTLLGIDEQQKGATSFDEYAVAGLRRQLTEIRHRVFTARTEATKKRLRQQDKALRQQLAAALQSNGWDAAATAKLAAWDPYNQNASADFFDPEWMFGLKDGFDIVVGNPPYISYYSRQAKSLADNLHQHYLEHYQFLKGTKKKSINTVMLFLEIATRISIAHGSICFIIDIGFFEQVYVEIRKYLANFDVREMVVNLSAFESVASGQVIISIKQYKPQHFQCVIKNDFQATGLVLSLQEFTQKQVNMSFENNLPNLVSSNTVKLGDICSITSGLEYGALRYLFLSKTKQSDRHHRAVNGSRNVPDKYTLVWKQEDGYVLFDKEYEQKLVSSGQNISKTGKTVYFISGDEQKYLEPKIFVRQSATEIIACLDEEDHYALRSLFCINLLSGKELEYDLKYILALLNSKLFSVYALAHGIIRHGEGKQPQIRVSGLSTLPIYKASQKQQNTIIKIVRKILEDKKANFRADTSLLEAEIDQFVYALYGLTAAEIALVEGRELSGEEAAQLAQVTPDLTAAAPPLLFTDQPPQGSFSEKRAQLEKLTHEATPVALQSLAAALADDNLTIRWQAATALKTIGGAQVIGALQAFMAHTDSAVGKAEAEKILHTLAVR